MGSSQAPCLGNVASEPLDHHEGPLQPLSKETAGVKFLSFQQKESPLTEETEASLQRWQGGSEGIC